MGDDMTGPVLLTGATGFVGGQVLRALAERSVVVRAVVREGKQGELNTLNYRSAKPAEFLCLTFMPERCAGIFISSLTANWMAPMVVPAKPTSTLAATNPIWPPGTKHSANPTTGCAAVMVISTE